MTIRSFDLLQPHSLGEASELLVKHGEEARPIAGGTTLVIMMKQRAVYYPYLIDLQSIPGLDQIKEEADGFRIGALVTHRDVEQSPLVRQAYPVLAEAFGQIGNVRVRATASVGGNLAHGDYRLDPPPVLLVLGAEVTVFGPQGSRIVPLKDFFLGMYETSLKTGEILVDVRVPPPPPESKAVYLRYSTLSANDWPCLGVAALLVTHEGRCRELRLAFSGVAMTPVRVGGLDFVRDHEFDDALIERILSVVHQQIAPFSDFRGSEWYKRHLVGVFVRRALARLNGQTAA